MTSLSLEQMLEIQILKQQRFHGSKHLIFQLDLLQLSALVQQQLMLEVEIILGDLNLDVAAPLGGIYGDINEKKLQDTISSMSSFVF